MRPRITWDDLTSAAQAAIADRTGRIQTVRMISAGANSPLAAVLEAENGPVFVKGMPAGSRGAASQAREAAVAPHVAGVAPKLLWHLPDAAGWDVLGFEFVDGRHADYTPGSPDVLATVELLTRIGEIEYPADAPARDVRAAFAAHLHDPAATELLAGSQLLHIDFNPENVLIGADGARMVDWAWPCRGAAWIDTCVLIVRLIAAGHTSEAAEACVADVPAWRSAPKAGVRVFAAASASLWGEIAEQDPQPWKWGMAAAARAWAATR
ncbi:aminoglycoside phosphotransferase [Lentzea sp. NPDC004782]|uniref:phosphotransferase family protein n=1 Tax=Lentzea sp. NPDC004782 TaxID=3154458 RepID=UPI0033A3A4E8